MAISYRPYEPQQEMLLPASLQDWLPKGHLAYFISDTVDALDLKAFYARYAGGGARNQPFHAAMMVKLLVYGYATGVFSSRKIERRLHDDLAFRLLGAGNLPKHRTIRDFRALHLLELSELFVQVVKLAREMGLVKLGTVAIDGTKIKANASRHKAMSYERMQQAEAELKAQIDALLERAKSTDAAEAEEPELDIPAEIERREVRLKAINEARQRIEQRQRDADIERGRSEDDERKPRDGDGNPTGGQFKREFGVPDPKAQDNFTDPDSRIMKSAGGGFDASYNAQTAVDETAHIIVVADAGYRSEANFQAVAASATELVVALGREGKRHAEVDDKKHPHTAAMAAKMQTVQGKAAYRKRKWIAEPPNGWIKSVLGFRQFSLRGLHRVQAEFKLVCLALNLRRMGAMKAA
jgi:transposase